MTDYLEMRADTFDFNTANHQPKVFDNGTRPVDEQQSAPRRTPSIPAVQEKANQLGGRTSFGYNVPVRVGSSRLLKRIEIEQFDNALIRFYDRSYQGIG
jgi:hypothetical protein